MSTNGPRKNVWTMTMLRQIESIRRNLGISTRKPNKNGGGFVSPFFRQRETRDYDKPQALIQLHSLPVSFAIHLGDGCNLSFYVSLPRRGPLCCALRKMRDDHFRA